MQAKRSSGSAVAAAPAPAKATTESALSLAKTPALFCVELSNVFRLRLNEIALLRLQRGLLRFIFPDELKTVGSIPVSSSSAVAAHTALTKKTELFNNFVKVQHARIFETVKLNSEEPVEQAQKITIQKLMSAPILDPERKVLGVIQVCRKGYDLKSCGADFTHDDLQLLEASARTASKMPFMNDAS
ncbi:MAG TPA: GAF domain-containing protein [Terriglobales bacterium]|nr:GAF domain-containing protein [Terriglobales bacterium]